MLFITSNINMSSKKIFLLLFIFCSLFTKAQQLQSPEQFLGYALGQKFTPHDKITGYFFSAAAASEKMMKLEKYGETYEGRPLIIAIVASPENFSRIEEIRKNNLRLTGLLNDKPGDADGPAIVWLSYNVHGNEPSSSEVSMKMLYELLNGKNAQLNEWLKNTVVIIDPCLNPDGRERYVNWFTQVSGKIPNADPNAREHDEPWPGGRVNHYNFDLNRDWAWQTQRESQERLAVYQQWMPQVHCDFHEQYPGSPYFFPPAAEPLHAAITQWQKDFQVTAGKNHAKYFDTNGWLYFTRQYFDLFYPSYGDTYPLFNGSIGMTYEQEGHSPGGIILALDNGDTLTLTERILHHFTTSLSTVEAASGNAQKLTTEFKKYFDNSRAGINNPFKNYIITKTDAGALSSLKELLAKNDISFGYATEAKSIKAFNYFSGKEETVAVQKNSLVIPAAQPKAVLLQVLFEPQPKLNDSATYDITAWAVPYAFGLQTFASKEPVAFSNSTPAQNTAQVSANAYGYIIPMHGFNDTKLLAALLKAGVKARFNETPFSFNDMRYSEGTVIVLRKGNEDKINKMLSAAAENNIHVTAISSGFMQSGFDFGSDKIHAFKNPVVGVFTGEGVSPNAAGEVWHLFEQQLNAPVSMLNANDIDGMSLKNYNVLILPDGNYKFLNSKESAADIKQWISNGGRLIAMEGAAKQIAALDWGLKLKKDPEEKSDTAHVYDAIRKYGDRDRESVVNNIPGAIYKLQLDNTHPVGFGYPDFYYTLKQNSRVYEFLKDGWNIATIKKQSQIAGFVGSKVKQSLNDGVLIGEIPVNKGSIVFFADDPLFRSFWENGKAVFCNAVYYAQ